MGYTLQDQIQGVLKFRREPERFFVDVLGIPQEHIWPKMVEIMHSVRDHQKTAVKAAFSVSKTYTVARLALQFLYCYGPNATVITTAPTDNQVVNVLWREIRDAKNGAVVRLPGEVLTQQLNIDDKWFAIGFSTRPDTITQHATAFQGFHNKYVLVIFDEAPGVMAQIWDAAESLMTNTNCRWVAIGNPTSSFGEFPDCFLPDSDWNQITISVMDTPNYQQDREVIPGIAGRDFERKMARKYGVGSNYYRSGVLGEIPEYAEGAIFGKEVKLAREEGRILDNIPHEVSCPVHTAWDLGISGSSNSMAIWFFQLVGQEVHVIDYMENWNEGMIWYIENMHAMRDKYKWLYGKHMAPHDMRVRELTTGATREETAARLGINFTLCGKPGKDGPVRLGLAEGIECVRQSFNRCWFDRSRCSQGLKALSEYHWKTLDTVSKDDHPVYSQNPVHDASSNGSDAFRCLCTGLKYNLSNMNSAGTNDWADFYSRVG